MSRLPALVAPIESRETQGPDLVALAHANLDAYFHAARGAFSPATARALRGDSALFAAWCSKAGRQALPADPDTVAMFVDDLAKTKKPATIRRYVSSVSHMHKAADMPNPCERNPVKLALKRMGKANGTEQRQAHGATRRLVDRMLEAGGSDARSVRNRAILATAYDTLARRSELVALHAQDLATTEHGDGSIKIRRSKTDQLGEGSIRYLAPDTMKLIREWLALAEPEGQPVPELDGAGEAKRDLKGEAATWCPLFRAVLKGGRIGGALSPYDVTRIFKQLAADAGVAPEIVAQISAHSTRIGAAQDMEALDISTAGIMRAAGWKSPTMVARYTKRQQARRSGSARLAQLQNRVG